MSQSESLKLLNCPFCNGKATWGMEDNSHGFHIRCEDCGVTGPEWGQFDDPEVYAAWNRRPSTADRGGEVEVKELRWVGNDPRFFRSSGALFAYEIKHDGDEPDKWSLHRNGKLISYHGTEKAAIAAAQADYTARIRSALATTAGEAWKTLPDWWRPTQTVRHALNEYHRVKSDFDSFDGDRRGIAAALLEREVSILRAVARDHVAEEGDPAISVMVEALIKALPAASGNGG